MYEDIFEMPPYSLRAVLLDGDGGRLPKFVPKFAALDPRYQTAVMAVIDAFDMNGHGENDDA